MSPTTAAPFIRPTLPGALLAAAGAGLIAALLNNAYGALFGLLTGNSHPLINVVSVSLASLIPMLVAGLAFFILHRLTARAAVLYALGAGVLAALSLAGPLAGPLPDGSQPPAFFAALTLPMHLIAGLVAIFGLPRLVRR